MSIQRAMLRKARPIMLRNRVAGEVCAGLMTVRPPELAPVPVPLEPALPAAGRESCQTDLEVLPPPKDLAPPVRMRIWVSPEQKIDWGRPESVCRQLQQACHTVGFEVIGNGTSIVFCLACHRDDECIVRTAFRSAFESCQVERIDWPVLSGLPESCWSDLRLRDFHAATPQPRHFTQPEQLPMAPITAVLEAVSQIPFPAVGLYQVLFQPVADQNTWKAWVAAFYDQEFLGRFLDNLHPVARSNPQVPSADERILAERLWAKAHEDKGLFAVALRVAVIGAGERGEEFVRALGVFGGLILHGGMPMTWLTEEAYRFLGPTGLRDMFRLGLAYRPGYLANSAELTSLVHLPAPGILERHVESVEPLEHLADVRALFEGTCIGDCKCAGQILPVHIPLQIRPECTHILGKPGRGKSELLKRIILDDIRRGDGMIVLDPHADLVRDIMDLMPPEHIDRTILLEWSDPEWVPLFNPMADVPPSDRGELADNLVASLKGVSEGWGHRAEHLVKSLCLGLLHLPRVSILDMSDALMAADEAGKELRKRVLEVVADPVQERFWRTDLAKYSASDRTPVINKLGLLLDSPPASYTFMQTGNKISLRKAMDEKKILLVNLAGLGQGSQSILGAMLLSLIYVETVTRARQERADRIQFQVHVDEAHMFHTDFMGNFLVQCRKYRIGICLANQYLRQYAIGQIDALGSVGSTVIFNVDASDAARLCKGLLGKVSPDDIIGLERYRAIARVDTKIVRIQTQRVPAPSHTNCRRQIIDLSHSRYYKRTSDVLKEINQRNKRWYEPFTPLAPAAAQGEEAPEELIYEEF